MLAACNGRGEAPGAPPRAGRFGSLRDLVLIERPGGAAAALFVDRFEVTRGDWRDFAASADGAAVDASRIRSIGDPALPAAGMDLVQARAFARWRFARLPTADEWQLVVGSDYPWGSRADATRANTAELGLGEPTPVGTFESGRKSGGDWPYDLIGNVSEWSESVPWAFCEQGLEVPVSYARCWRRALATPALVPFKIVPGLVPSLGVVAAGGAHVPREVLGADFLTPMTQRREVLTPTERRDRTGLRLYSSAQELLHALWTSDAPLLADDAERLRRFVARGRHQEVLLAAHAALPERLRAVARGPIAELLRAELGLFGLALEPVGAEPREGQRR